MLKTTPSQTIKTAELLNRRSRGSALRNSTAPQLHYHTINDTVMNVCSEQLTASGLSAEESPTGASQQLTPACQINMEGFQSLFNHRSVLSEQEFFELLKGRVVTNKPLMNRNGENYDNEQARALNGSVDDIKKIAFRKLDKIKNLSPSVLMDDNNQLRNEAAVSSIFVKYAEEMAENNVFPPTTGRWEDYPNVPT